MKFLEEIFGEDIIHTFQKDHVEDCIDLYREFELRKRKIAMHMEKGSTVAMKIPVALYELYKEKKGRGLKDDINSKSEFEKWRGKLSCAADKMKIDHTVLQSFFKRPLEDLIEHIRDILGELPVRGTRTFIIVGGFAESQMVQDYVRSKFPNMTVIVPFDAGLAVLKGAVIFGHAPMVVTSRVCPRTYGMAVSKLYVEGRYPASKAEMIGGREVVRNVFHSYMAMGAPTKVGQIVKSLPLSVSKGQTHARVRIFSSKDPSPEFVSDEGCSYLGEIVVTIPEMEYEEGETVEVTMTFGGTELHVEATEKKSGKSYKSRFDFLGGD